MIEIGSVALAARHEWADGRREAIETSLADLGNGYRELRLEWRPDAGPAPARTVVEARVPLADLHHVHVAPLLDGLAQKHWLHLPWSIEQPVSTHCGLPFILGYNRHGRNRFFLGALDQVADATVSFALEYPAAGDRPRMRDGIFRYERRWDEPPAAGTLTFLVSQRDDGWEQVVQDYAGWHDRRVPPAAAPWPPAALEPVWCSWYAWLERVTQRDLEGNLAVLRGRGIGAVIIDAGWSATDTKVVPDTAGDWEVDEGKFPDLRRLVRAIQAHDLRAILWVAPLFVGARARARQALRPLLGWVDGQEQNSLDPRLAATQQHVAELAGGLMRRYELDGLKIDFLDPSPGFRLGATRLDVRPGLTYTTRSVAEGTRRCLERISATIRAVRADALIEYRQSYANLATRPYATAFRAQDSPFDPEHSRHLVGLLRLTCPGIPLHADPALWVEDEALPNVARFLASMCLFSVPTYSMDFTTLPAAHGELIQRWHEWYRPQAADIHRGRLQLLSDDPRFSCLANVSERAVYAGLFARQPPFPIRLENVAPRPLWLFNGTTETQLAFDLRGWGRLRYQVTDCQFRPVAAGELEANGQLAVPVAGLAQLTPLDWGG